MITRRFEADKFKGQVGDSFALSRIRDRQPQILRRALEIQREHGDPIQNLVELLGKMPGSQEDWERLLGEP